MIKLFDWEISFRRETTEWAGEGIVHVWEYIFKIEKITPYEREHRAMLKKERDLQKQQKML